MIKESAMAPIWQVWGEREPSQAAAAAAAAGAIGERGAVAAPLASYTQILIHPAKCLPR